MNDVVFMNVILFILRDKYCYCCTSSVWQKEKVPGCRRSNSATMNKFHGNQRKYMMKKVLWSIHLYITSQGEKYFQNDLHITTGAKC